MAVSLRIKLSRFLWMLHQGRKGLPKIPTTKNWCIGRLSNESLYWSTWAVGLHWDYNDFGVCIQQVEATPYLALFDCH